MSTKAVIIPVNGYQIFNWIYSDCREETLHDVIVQIEPRLFEQTTGLRVSDFNLLCALNVFNSEVMNDAIYKFKRYEDASLSYEIDGISLDSDALEGKTELISPEEYRVYSAMQYDSTLN